MATIHTLEVGQVVYSKCGRDKGLPFIVLNLDGGFAWLADGGLRRLERPKKKKLMHLQPVKYIDEALTERIALGLHLEDADFRKALEPFNRKPVTKKAVTAETASANAVAADTKDNANNNDK